MLKLFILCLSLDDFYDSPPMPPHLEETSQILWRPIWNQEYSVYGEYNDNYDNYDDFKLCSITQGIGNTSEGTILFRGGPGPNNCGLEVTPVPEYRVRIGLPTRGDDLSSTEDIVSSRLLVEYGNEDPWPVSWIPCIAKYFVIIGQSEACSFIFYAGTIQLYIEGSMTVSIGGVSQLDSQPDCPINGQHGQNIEASQTTQVSNCSSVKGYSTKITCLQIIWPPEYCTVIFPHEICNATLGRGEVAFHCSNDFPDYEAVIIYSGDKTTLSSLSMTFNNIVSIEAYAFGGLYRLQTLHLYHNTLVSLEAEVFLGLYSLRKLLLSHNTMERIDVGAFQGLGNLLSLELDNNRLSTLPDGLFDGTTNLRILGLNNNKLKILSGGLFKRSTKLSIIDLGSNEILAIDGTVFVGELSFLRELSLYGNALRMLPTNIFSRMVSLECLYLQCNQLVSLNASLLRGLNSLVTLNLWSNKLAALPTGIFHQLRNLSSLYLSDNRLAMLPEGAFLELDNLERLSLDVNKLITLNGDLFQDLVKLRFLYLGNNNLTTLPTELFSTLINLYTLGLEYNKLISLRSGLFQAMGNLTELQLYDNSLTSLPEGLFIGLERLTVLHLHENQLVNLQDNAFLGIENITLVSLHNNKLTNLSSKVFKDFYKLYTLSLDDNQLTSLENGLFRDLRSSFFLDMSGNKLVELSDKVFTGLRHLEHLDLESNQLESLGALVFKKLFRLTYLSLAKNKLAHLDYEIFDDIVDVRVIDLSDNRLRTLPNIKNLPCIYLLKLEKNSLTWLAKDSFSGLSGLELYVDQHEICECFIINTRLNVRCSALQNRSPYLTCERLLSDKVLMVFIWIIAINALAGNVFVLVWRLKNPQKNRVQDILLGHLAMSDALMGIYMMIIAGADIYFGEYFPTQSETWRSGMTCRIAGALSITASEASVFFVTMISIDRCINMKFPYTSRKLGKKSTLYTSVLIWLVSLGLGFIPSLLSGSNFKFYDNSHVCIGLPLALTKTYHKRQNDSTLVSNNRPRRRLLSFDEFKYASTYTFEFKGFVTGLYYSTALFIGVNGLCYLIILGCYVEIVRVVSRSSKEAGRTRDKDEQMRLTKKVTIIVATDFMCWFPIVVLGILVQTRLVTLPPSVYAWLVTFVLPINSSINPYLYTIAETFSNYREKNKAKKKNKK